MGFMSFAKKHARPNQTSLYMVHCHSPRITMRDVTCALPDGRTKAAMVGVLHAQSHALVFSDRFYSILRAVSIFLDDENEPDGEYAMQLLPNIRQWIGELYDRDKDTTAMYSVYIGAAIPEQEVSTDFQHVLLAFDNKFITMLVIVQFILRLEDSNETRIQWKKSTSSLFEPFTSDPDFSSAPLPIDTDEVKVDFDAQVRSQLLKMATQVAPIHSVFGTLCTDISTLTRRPSDKCYPGTHQCGLLDVLDLCTSSLQTFLDEEVEEGRKTVTHALLTINNAVIPLDGILNIVPVRNSMRALVELALLRVAISCVHVYRSQSTDEYVDQTVGAHDDESNALLSSFISGLVHRLNSKN